MLEQRDFLNVRSLAFALTAGPLALLLFFAALDMSWARFSHAPSKVNVATELTSKMQPTTMNDR